MAIVVLMDFPMISAEAKDVRWTTVAGEAGSSGAVDVLASVVLRPPVAYVGSWLVVLGDSHYIRDRVRVSTCTFARMLPRRTTDERRFHMVSCLSRLYQPRSCILQ